jgi:uncharacterized OB-fold protein
VSAPSTPLADVSGPEVTRDARSAEFYDAAARGELVIRRCTACGRFLAPETRTCSSCASTDLVWVPASGKAELVSWVVVHHPPLPALADQVPFTVGIVELAEGPWLLQGGTPLSVAFVRPEVGESYPVFLPA